MSLSGKCDKLMSNLFCPEMPDLWFYPLPLVGEKRSEIKGGTDHAVSYKNVSFYSE